ncbi:MAG: hypothetical protein QOJ29_1001, partial [Thermoleophilaceae bacterium]|nr:hypothetical protein [Thermoleophilaceae bacterium]
MPLAPSKRLAAVLAVTAVAAAGLLIPASGSAVPTCTIYWTGASSDNWSTMANWAFNAAGTTAATRTPVASDYVCMSTTPTARPLIRITAGSSVSVNGINWTTSAGSLAVRSSSALTIGTAVPSTLYALEVSGSSTLTLNGNLGVTNGATLKNAVVNGTKILTLSGTTTSVIGDPTTAATVTFDGAKLSNQGPLTVQGITTGFTLNYLYLYNGAQFTNTGSVTWGDQAQVQDNDTASYIANLATGAMSYAGSSATAEANLITNFSNAGTVTVTSGVFDVWDMPATIPSDKGTYAISANATVATAGGYPRAFGSGGKTTGAGTFLVRGSTTLSMVNGVSFGALDVQGSVSNPAAATITVGDLVWEGQIQGGTTNVTGTASLGGSSAWGTATGATVVLKGTSSMYAGTGVLMYGGSSVKNQGTLALAQGSSFSEQDSGTPSSFVNDTTGTLKWTGASAADQVDVNGATFANKGTLNVVKGIVGLGNASLQTGTTQTGAGTIRSVARVDITSGVSLTNFDVAVGDVYPAGTVTVSNLTVQGSIYGGNVLIPTDGTVQLGGASNYAQLRGTTLTNSGAATFAAAGYMPVLQYAGSTFTNKGSLTFRGNTGFLEQDSGTPSSLVNDTGGTINFAGANATDEFDQNSVVFTNKGTLNVTQGILGLGNATLTASTSQTGSGRLRTVGRVDANTGISLKKLDVATGDLYAAGTLSVSDLLFEGSIYGGTTTIPATGTVQLGGPSGYAALHGGTLVNNGSASFPPAGANYAALLQYAGSTLTNKGTLNLSASGVLEQDYATPSTFVNDTGGTVKFAGASATDEFDQNSVVFTNKGTLNVTQGILGLGNTILTASTSQTGSGRLRTVARVDANDGVSLTKLDIVSDLYAAGALSVSDLLFEGSIYGGTTTIPATGTMQLGGPSGYAALHGGTLVNNGSASFPPVGSSYPALLEYAGSTFTNKGTLNLSASGVLEQDYATPSTFVNDTGGT